MLASTSGLGFKKALAKNWAAFCSPEEFFQECSTSQTHNPDLKFLEVFGSFWKFLEVFGSFWKFLPGSFGKFLEVFGSCWKFLVVFGSFWKFLEVFGSFWKFLEVSGSFSKFVDHRRLRLHLACHLCCLGTAT